jgi:hypothetical protein
MSLTAIGLSDVDAGVNISNSDLRPEVAQAPAGARFRDSDESAHCNLAD